MAISLGRLTQHFQTNPYLKFYLRKFQAQRLIHSTFPKSPCSSQNQSSAVTSPPSGGWRSCCLVGEDSSGSTAGPSQISPLRRCRWPSAAADLPSRRGFVRSPSVRTKSAQKPGKKKNNAAMDGVYHPKNRC